MALSQDMLDTMRYVRFFKGNYIKGIDNLRIALTHNEIKQELISDKNFLNIVFGGLDDRNQDELISLLDFYGLSETAFNNYLSLSGYTVGATLSDTLDIQSTVEAIVETDVLAKSMFKSYEICYLAMGKHYVMSNMFGVLNFEKYIISNQACEQYFYDNGTILTTVGAGLYTMPAGAKSVNAILIAGGGNGNANSASGTDYNYNSGEGGNFGEMKYVNIQAPELSDVPYTVGANQQDTILDTETAVTDSNLAPETKILTLNPRKPNVGLNTGGAGGEGVGAGGGGGAGGTYASRWEGGYGGWGTAEDVLYPLISINATAQDGQTGGSNVNYNGGVGAKGAIILCPAF